jgi:uncharacterized protein YuzE
MKIEYDPDADAMYITIKKGEVDRTKQIDNYTLVDYDKKGDILGIELLFVKERNSNVFLDMKKAVEQAA